MAPGSQQQPSSLLRSLVDPQQEEQCLTVLNVGPALPETVAFFAEYPCNLYFCDPFEALPIELPEESEDTLEEVFEPHLLRQGLIQKTARGRVVTSRGRVAVGLPADGSGDDEPSLFDR